MNGITDNYYFINDSDNEFENITSFVKSAIIKDKKIITQNETDESKVFGDLLKKYYNSQLTPLEINKLIVAVLVYNKEVDSKFDKIDNIDDALLEYYGLPTDIPDDKPDKQRSYYLDIFKRAQKINIGFYSCGYKKYYEKRSAGTTEIKYADSNEPFVAFDFHLTYDDLVVSLATKTLDSGDISPKQELGVDLNSLNTNNLYGILIQYKELNEVLRTILRSDENEVLFEMLLKENSDANNRFIDYFTTMVKNSTTETVDVTFPTDIQDRIKSVKDKYELYISNELPEEPTKEQYIRESIRNFYGNPFNARNLEDNSIISYYIGDEYFNKSFGTIENERNRIYKFIGIYNETREYYYKVLFNFSFVNDTEYSLFSKFFISSVAIERYLSNRITLLADPETFTITDIKNFLSSFGLSNISNIIDKYATSMKYQYSKAIIESYSELMAYKGSKHVVDLLINIFSFDNSKLTIKKYQLVPIAKKNENKKTENDPEYTSDYEYYFVEVPYSSDDSLTDLKTAAATPISLETIISSDEKWKATKEKLDMLTFNSANTKYLTLCIRNNIFSPVIILSYAASFFEKIAELKLTKLDSLENVISLEDGTKYTIFEAILKIVELFKEYAGSIANEAATTSETEKKYYGFNFDKFDLATVAKELNDDESITSGEQLFKELYAIFESYMRFPIAYLNGENLLSSTELEVLDECKITNVDSGIIYSIEDINETRNTFDTKYSVTVNPLEKSETTKTLENITEELSNLLSAFNLYCNQNNYSSLEVYISLFTETLDQLKFLKTTIEEFISYTTELYQSDSISEYDTAGERMEVFDKMTNLTINQVYNERLYFDESLTIEEVIQKED